MQIGDANDLYRTYESIQFAVVGQKSEEVQIVDIRSQTLERREPPQGTLFLTIAEGGWSEVKSLFLDLDNEQTPARTVINGSTEPILGNDYFFDVNTATVALGERIEFAVVVSTANCNCAFELVVKLNDGQEIVVNDGGHPWRVSSYARNYAVAYNLVPDYGPAGVRTIRCDWPLGCT